MTLIDYVIVAIIVLGTVQGFMKGFLRQLASVAGFLIGLVAARMLYMSLAEKISPMIDSSMTVVQIISFVAIWLLVPLIFLVVASLLTHALEAIALGWVNRLLGLLLGALTWVLVLGLLANILEFLDTSHWLLSQTVKEESVLYYPIKDFIGSLFPVARGLTEYILT